MKCVNLWQERMNLLVLSSGIMTKYIRLALLLLFPLSLAIAMGCDRKKGAEAELLAFDSAHLEQYIPLRTDTDRPALQVIIKYVYPSEDKVLTEIFNGLLFGDSLMDAPSPVDAMEGFVRVLGEDYRSNNAEASLQGLPADLLDYVYKIENTIAYCDTGMVATRINIYTYEGGAHPENTVRFANVLRSSGKVLEERDIFKGDYTERLSALIVEQLVRDFGKSSPSELDAIGFFNAEEIQPNGNFMADDKGLTYCFNEYQIAAYARGAVYVRLGYDVLAPLLRDDSPLKRYIP